MPDRPTTRASSRKKGNAPPNPKAGAAISPLAAPTSQPSCQSAGADPITAGDTTFLPCRHCHLRRPPGCGRGLCRVCWDDPKIRKRYPWLRRQWGRGWEYDTLPAGTAPEPTRIRPGPEKIAVLIARRKAKQQLHHPADVDSAPADPDQFMLDIVYAAIKRVTPIQKGDGRVRWRAHPQWKGRQFHLGYFDTRAEACLAIIEWKKNGRPVPEKKKRGRERKE